MTTHNNQATDPTQRLLVGSRSPNNSLVPATATPTSFVSNVSVVKFNDSSTSGTSLKKPHVHPEHRKSIDLETHGDEAITLLQHTKSPFGKCFDISRLTLGSLLLIISIFSIVYAVT
eukprot:719909_1